MITIKLKFGECLVPMPDRICGGERRDDMAARVRGLSVDVISISLRSERRRSMLCRTI